MMVLESYKAIADIFLDQGELVKAIGFYNKALSNTKVTKSNMGEINELRYSLGSMYKKAGKINEAFRQWEEIANVDPSFKDVSEKLNLFKDMKKERELLVKEVFPELRRIYAERFVTITEVDLRWGITEEQAAEGKVLPICLKEIAACRQSYTGSYLAKRLLPYKPSIA